MPALYFPKGSTGSDKQRFFLPKGQIYTPSHPRPLPVKYWCFLFIYLFFKGGRIAKRNFVELQKFNPRFMRSWQPNTNPSLLPPPLLLQLCQWSTCCILQGVGQASSIYLLTWEQGPAAPVGLLGFAPATLLVQVQGNKRAGRRMGTGSWYMLVLLRSTSHQPRQSPIPPAAHHVPPITCLPC